MSRKKRKHRLRKKVARARLLEPVVRTRVVDMRPDEEIARDKEKGVDDA